MPELPEVEVIRMELLPAVTNKIFSAPRLIFPESVRFPSPGRFVSRLDGSRIVNLQRKGKYLVFNLDRGLLLIHLGMTGRLLFPGNRRVTPDSFPYLRAMLPFCDRTALYFCDKRKFGGIWLGLSIRELPAGFLNLGPDIYRQVDRKSFTEALRNRPRMMIKPLLLNQRVVSGLGNIYTDESLYLSFIHPRRRAGTLAPEEITSLYRAIRQTLDKGIDCGGTSIRDFRNAGNREGGFQHFLEVYNRQGSPCRRCGAAVSRITVGGRGTYFCPQCQKE